MLAQVLLIGTVALTGLAPTRCASPPSPDRLATTNLRYQKFQSGDGNYNYGYQTSNGISVHEKGYIRNPLAAMKDQINAKEGCYSYTSPEGTFVSVVYVADEGGFRPKTRITHPQDGARHQEHLADPCSPDLTGPIDTPDKGEPALATTPKEENQWTPSTPGNGWTPEPTSTVSSTPVPLPPVTEDCTGSGCSCPKVAPPPCSFRLKDGSSVAVTYVPQGKSYQTEVKVHFPSSGSYDSHVCRPGQPAIEIPETTTSKGWGWERSGPSEPVGVPSRWY